MRNHYHLVLEAPREFERQMERRRLEETKTQGREDQSAQIHEPPSTRYRPDPTEYSMTCGAEGHSYGPSTSMQLSAHRK